MKRLGVLIGAALVSSFTYADSPLLERVIRTNTEARRVVSRCRIYEKKVRFELGITAGARAEGGVETSLSSVEERTISLGKPNHIATLIAEAAVADFSVEKRNPSVGLNDYRSYLAYEQAALPAIAPVVLLEEGGGGSDINKSLAAGHLLAFLDLLCGK